MLQKTEMESVGPKQQKGCDSTRKPGCIPASSKHRSCRKRQALPPVLAAPSLVEQLLPTFLPAPESSEHQSQKAASRSEHCNRGFEALHIPSAKHVPCLRLRRARNPNAHTPFR